MNQQRGFTLLELMIVVAMAGILMAIGVPSFQTLITNNRIAANTNEFITALNLARSEAIKRSTPVRVCKSDDGATCPSGNWNQGWIVYFVNADGDNEILRVFDPLSGGDTLTSSVDELTYTALGALAGDNTITFDFSLCRKGFNEGRNQVEINAVGRAHVGRVACS